MRSQTMWMGVVALLLVVVGCGGNGQDAGHEGHQAPAAQAQDPASVGHEGHQAAAAPEGQVQYHCPMHPNYISDRPGECPICGMSLVPLEKEEITVPVAGQAEVRISPERQQLIGVRKGRVERRSLERTIRTVGKVDYDEQKMTHVHTRVDGWIRRLYVNFTGELVKKGQPLFTLYSPELVATQEEYLLALRSSRHLKDNPVPEAAEGAAGLLEAARRRLELFEVTDAQIRQIEGTGKPLTDVTIVAHSEGFVIEKRALEGMRVMEGDDLYTLADLSDVWVQADIYEYELPLVQVGQPATVSLSYYPGEAFQGKVVYIYPYVESETRTAKVRIEFANPGWRLKPGMFANVEIQAEQGEALVVPGNAVLDSGTRRIVFVDLGEGRLQPREVSLGRPTADGFEVLSGLEEGELVVTSANFLIDSESQIKAAMGSMAGHQH
ncbi:MAG: efflux RND transporter periplasmic adaptor subunit [Candidatus Latescibacterota bacterium]